MHHSSILPNVRNSSNDYSGSSSVRSAWMRDSPYARDAPLLIASEQLESDIPNTLYHHRKISFLLLMWPMTQCILGIQSASSKCTVDYHYVHHEWMNLIAVCIQMTFVGPFIWMLHRRFWTLSIQNLFKYTFLVPIIFTFGWWILQIAWYPQSNVDGTNSLLCDSPFVEQIAPISILLNGVQSVAQFGFYLSTLIRIVL